MVTAGCRGSTKALSSFIPRKVRFYLQANWPDGQMATQLSQAPKTEHGKLSIDQYVNEVSLVVCGSAHPALQDTLCGPILGPKLQALALLVKRGLGPASEGEMCVAPRSSKLLLDHVWSLLCGYVSVWGWDQVCLCWGKQRLDGGRRKPKNFFYGWDSHSGQRLPSFHPNFQRAQNGKEGSPLCWLIEGRSAVHPGLCAPGSSSLSSSSLPRW